MRKHSLLWASIWRALALRSVLGTRRAFAEKLGQQLAQRLAQRLGRQLAYRKVVDYNPCKAGSLLHRRLQGC